MTDVIHHVQNLPKAMKEIRRVLRPRGRCCIATQSHEQIRNRPIARFLPGTVAADIARYPDVDVIIEQSGTTGLHLTDKQVLGAGDKIFLDEKYLELVKKKGYSMLHLISEREYQGGLKKLEHALSAGVLEVRRSGETLIWLEK
jgi:hypothetical protein